MPVEYVMASFVPHPHQQSVHVHHSSIKNVYNVALLAASIPNARYILHPTNNYFFWDPDGANVRVELPLGNRAQTTAMLAQEIQSAVRAQVPGEAAFVCQSDPDGRLRLLTQSAAFALSFGRSTLYRNMGMDGTRVLHSVPQPLDNGALQHVLPAPFFPARYTSHLYDIRVGLGTSEPLDTLEHVIIRRDDAITYFSAQKKNRRTSRRYDPCLPSVRSFRFDVLDDAGQRMDLNGLRTTLVLAVYYRG